MADSDRAKINNVSIHSIKKWGWVIAALVFAALAVFNLWNSADLLRRAVPTFNLSRTTEMTPIDISLSENINGRTNTLRMRIPKAYLTDPVNWSGGEQASLRIETGLPNLEPRAAIDTTTAYPGTPEFDARDKRTRQGINIVLNAHVIGEGLVKNQYQAIQSNFGQGKTGKYERLADKFGLEQYQQLVCGDKWILPGGTIDTEGPRCRVRGAEIFIASPSAREAQVYYSCTHLEENPEGGCNAYVQFRNWQMNYIFRRSEISRWQEFDSAVRRLLSGFVVNENVN